MELARRSTAEVTDARFFTERDVRLEVAFSAIPMISTTKANIFTNTHGKTKKIRSKGLPVKANTKEKRKWWRSPFSSPGGRRTMRRCRTIKNPLQYEPKNLASSH